MTVWYYINRKGDFVGSINHYKIEQMSIRDSDGKVYNSHISAFNGTLLDMEWLG